MASKEESYDKLSTDENPFKATLLWKKLISNLKNNVTVKKKRNCELAFNGKIAVDVVFECLKSERNLGASSLITKDITRFTAVKVCQAFLDGNVFVSLSSSKYTDSPRKQTFVDDENTLYQFTDEKDNVLTTPTAVKVRQAHNEQNLWLFSSLASPSSFYSFKNSKNRKTLLDDSNVPNLIRCEKVSATNLNANEFDYSMLSPDLELIKKQAALRHLLQLIDLPFIENLIPDEEKVQHHQMDKKLLEEPISLQIEMWIAIVKQLTGSSCFYYDNPIELDEDELKRQEYLKLRQYFRENPLLIVPACYNEVFVAILALMKHKRFSQALRAAQLAVLLLPSYNILRLQLLLTFMDVVANDNTVQLEKDIGNRQLVLNHFSSLIFNIQLLATSESVILTHFLLVNRVIIFTIPDFIKEEMLNCKLQSKHVPIDFKYCDQIPSSIYKDRILEESSTAVKQLIEAIMDSTKISLSEKQKYLKRCKKYHPEIYEKCMKQ